MFPWGIGFHNRCWIQYWKVQKLWLRFSAEALDLWISSASVAIAPGATDAKARSGAFSYCPTCGAALQRQSGPSFDYSDHPTVVPLFNRLNK